MRYQASLREIFWHARSQSQSEWIVLIPYLRGVDAPELRKVCHILFMRESAAALLPDFCQRLFSGEPASDELICLGRLFLRYCEYFIRCIGRREAAEIEKPQFGLFWGLLAKVR